MRNPLTIWREYQRCTYWRENIVFAIVAAIGGATWTDAATFTGVTGWTLGVPKQFSI